MSAARASNQKALRLHSQVYNQGGVRPTSCTVNGAHPHDHTYPHSRSLRAPSPNAVLNACLHDVARDRVRQLGQLAGEALPSRRCCTAAMGEWSRGAEAAGPQLMQLEWVQRERGVS